MKQKKKIGFVYHFSIELEELCTFWVCTVLPARNANSVYFMYIGILVYQIYRMGVKDLEVNCRLSILRFTFYNLGRDN